MVFSKKWLRNHPQFLLHFLIHIDVLMLCRKFELIPTSIFRVMAIMSAGYCIFYYYFLFSSLTDSSDRYFAARTLSHWSTVLRLECMHTQNFIGQSDEIFSDEVLTFIDITDTDLSPDGTLISKLMEYIWTHWEEPIDVRGCGQLFINNY